MARVETTDVYYDPYDVDINADPYPVYAASARKRRSTTTRSYDFWMLSRHADVEKALRELAGFSSTRWTSSTSSEPASTSPAA